jgi:hypothetical protein
MARGLERFKIAVKEYGGLGSLAVGAGTIPFILAFASLAPPWPPTITPVTAVVQLAVLILVYQKLNRSRKRVVDRVMVSSFCALFAASLIYVTVLLNFTYQLPDSSQRLPRGFFCTSIAQKQFPDSCPFLARDELNEVEYVPSRLWTNQSMTAVQVTLLVLWMGAFISLTTLVGTFVVYQKRGG